MEKEEIPTDLPLVLDVCLDSPWDLTVTFAAVCSTHSDVLRAPTVASRQQAAEGDLFSHLNLKSNSLMYIFPVHSTIRLESESRSRFGYS